MDEKWDKIVTVIFWICFIGPFMILLPHEWLKAFLYLDPSYVTHEESTIDWAVATFAFIGLLLALFVPKVSEFDRQLTKEMGVTDHEIKPSTWRCVLFRLYGEYPSWMQWVFDFFLSSQHYFIILCVLGGVFIFCPILRGVLILGTLIYSYYILISMESLSNIEQYETLFLKNIKDPEVFALLKKYVEKVYSTEGHPRQEAFYMHFMELVNLINEKRFEEYIRHNKLRNEIIRVFSLYKVSISSYLSPLMIKIALYPFINVFGGYTIHFYCKKVIDSWFSHFKQLLMLSKDHAELREHIISNLEQTLCPSRNIFLSNRVDKLFFKYNDNAEYIPIIPHNTLEILPYSSKSASSKCLEYSEQFGIIEISSYYFALTSALLTVGLLYEIKDTNRLKLFLESLCLEYPTTLLCALLIVASGCYKDYKYEHFWADSFKKGNEGTARILNYNVEHPQVGVTLLGLMAFQNIAPQEFASAIKELIQVYPYLKDIFITTISDNAWLLKSLEIFRKELSNQNLLNMDINFYKKYRTNQSKYPKRFSPLNFIEYQRYNLFECQNPISIRDYLQTHFLGILEEYCQKKHPKTKYFRRFKRLFEKIPTAFWEASCFDQTFTTIVHNYKPAIFTAKNLQDLDKQLLRDIFPNDEDTKTILNKWEAFHIKLKSLYEEEGWVSST
jgi:hypothetical protein